MNETLEINFSALFPLIEEKIAQGDCFTFTAFGNSMHPYLKNGAHRVTLAPIGRKLKKNDVVFYRIGDGVFILHRVVKISDGKMYLCGDNQYNLERYTRSTQLIAILTSIEKNGKLRDPSGLLTKLWCAHLPLRRFYLHVISYIKRRIFKLANDFFSSGQS